MVMVKLRLDLHFHIHKNDDVKAAAYLRIRLAGAALEESERSRILGQVHIGFVIQWMRIAHELG